MFTGTIIRRTLLVVLCIAAIPLLLPAEETHLDIKVPSCVENDLFGPVKKVTTEYSYNMSDRSYKEELQYDDRGNLLSKTKWDRDGDLSFFSTNHYNSAGCRTLYRIENPRKGSTNEYEVIINVPARKIALRDLKSGEVELREYSPAKYHLTTRTVAKNKKRVSSSQFKRRADNKEKQYISRDEHNRVRYSVAIDWNDNKLQSRELIIDREDDSKTLKTFKYQSTDQHGNWTQRLTVAHDAKSSDKKMIYEKFSTRTIEYHGE